MVIHPLLLLALSSQLVRAGALAGAWESFPDPQNTNTWALFSYFDELTEPPLWAGPEIDENTHAYSFFLGGEGVWFFADELTASGEFVGDYGSQKVAGVDVSVLVDPQELDFIDLAVFADGPGGPDYYFSSIYTIDDLGPDFTWHDLSFGFDELWYQLDGDDFIPFVPDAAFLASVEEAGIRIFPLPGTSEDSYAGIDDFILVPTVEAPALKTSLAGGRFRISFAPNPGVACTVEQLVRTPAPAWQPVTGYVDLLGPQVFSTPVTPGRGIYRVEALEWLTPVFSP